MPERKNQKNLFIETLKWISGKLKSNNIPYMVTGGSAVGFWGHIRTTMDIDIVIQIPQSKVNAFAQSIKDEAYIDEQEIRESFGAQGLFNVIYNKTSFKVDFIIKRNEPYESEKFARKVNINFLNNDLYVISPEDLIISKMLWSKSSGGSERQAKDCESIYLLNKDRLDMKYMQKWIQYFNLNADFQKIAES
jgi:hypothetical protein